MNIAVIFAGGVGKRMGNSGVPKQFLKLYNKEIIVYTLELFEKNKLIDKIIVSCLEDKIDLLMDLVIQYNLKKVVKIVKGGTTGQESIYNGLCVAEKISNSDEDIVLIHDGVRPLITDETILDNINGVKLYGSSITIAPAIETIVKEKEEYIIDILPRENCFLARAPQSFYLKDIFACHKKSKKDKKEFIDSASMMSYYGYKLHLINGPAENIKITTPIDFYMFKAILDMKNNIDVLGV